MHHKPYVFYVDFLRAFLAKLNWICGGVTEVCFTPLLHFYSSQTTACFSVDLGILDTSFLRIKRQKRILLGNPL